MTEEIKSGPERCVQATAFRLAMLELAILVLLIVGFLVALVLLVRARSRYGALEARTTSEEDGGGGAPCLH